MLFGKGSNTLVLRKRLWHFVGIICHPILEGKSTGIQTWLDTLWNLSSLYCSAWQLKERWDPNSWILSQLAKAQCPRWDQDPVACSSKLWWDYGYRDSPVSPTAQVFLDHPGLTLAVGSSTSLLPRSASDSAWCLSPTVFFSSCGLCSSSDSQHQRGRSAGRQKCW